MFVDQKNFESYFSDQLIFSNIRGRTFRRMYRLALPLHAPETFSSSNKSRIFLYKLMRTFLYLSGWMTQLPTQTHRYVSSFSKLELALEVRALPSHRRLQTRQQEESLQTGKECEYEELRFRSCSPLACRVIGIACSSWLFSKSYHIRECNSVRLYWDRH